MKPQSPARILGVLALFAFLLTPSARLAFAQAADSEEISQLLSQAKSHAVLAADDAATLESYTHSKLSWQSHNAKLTEIAEHVNALGKVDKELQDNYALGSPWQQQSITQIHSLLVDMTAQITATIKHLSENQSRIHLQPYRDYAHASYERASRTAEVIRDFVEYDKAKSTAEALEQKLELPASVSAGTGN